MSWIFEYSLDGSTWNGIPQINIDINSLTKTEQIHNNLEPVVNSCSFSIVRPTAQQLSDFNNNRNILFKILDNSGSAYFAGILDNEFQFTVDVRVDSFKLTVYDYGWFIHGALQYKIGQRFGPSVWDPPSTVLSNFFVHDPAHTGSSIVDTLIARFSAMLGMSISVIGSAVYNAGSSIATVDQFSFKATDTYEDKLNAVLFEYGYTYFFDATGNFNLYQLFPPSLATSHTFQNAADPADMFTGLQFQKKFAQKDGAEVDWYNHILLQKTLISFDTSNGYYAPGAPDQSTCNIELKPAINPTSYVWQSPFYPSEYVPGSAIFIPGAVKLVGQGGPSVPGNPQTIPWPSPANGDNWLVTDPGYADDGYIYQYQTSDHQWHQQSRSLGETATLGALGYEYTTLGWIIITPNPNPIVYTQFQITERTLISVDPATIEIHLQTDDGTSWPTAPSSYNTGIGVVIHPVAEPLICNAAGGALSTPSAPIVLFPDRMFFVLQNTDQYVTYHITQYYVLGNALVKGNKNIARVFLIDNLHTNLDVRDTAYIVTQGDANALVNGLANYYKYSGQTITFDSDTNVACGALVQITDSVSGLNVTARVVTKNTRSEYDLRGVKGIFPRFSYTCEAVNNAVFTAQGQTSYAAVPIVNASGAGQIAGAVGSSTVASAIYQGIFDSGAGTTALPSTPSMLNVVPTGLHALQASWSRQANLTGNYWYEIQCSLDNTNWYAPQQNGSAIVSGVFNGSAVVVTELFNHANIPNSGTPTIPAGTQVWYRVRCRTQNNLVSGWSTGLSGTSLTVQPGDIAVSSIYASLIATGNFQFYGSISSMPNLSPNPGDTNIYLDTSGNLICNYWDGVNWNLLFEINATSAQIQIPSIAGPVPTLIQGGAPSTSSWGPPYSGGTPGMSAAFVVGGMLPSVQAFKAGGDFYMGGNSIYDLAGQAGKFSIAKVGTSSALAAENPVLVAGKIGYETDTISFKIGDGSTAYNSLTYAYQGLLVAGEPSFGTPHTTKDADRSATLVVNTSVNTAGVWSAAVTMTGVPAGAKAAWCRCRVVEANAIPRLAVEAATGYTLSDITSGNNVFKYWGVDVPVAGGYPAVVVKVHLDANGQFKWCVDVSSSTVQIGSAIDYEM